MILCCHHATMRTFYFVSLLSASIKEIVSSHMPFILLFSSNVRITDAHH
jgi:hypothetical protein